ncbi:tRNA (guanine37-N1)-methyltransferase [Aliiroseovarius halocynthiae]|uniref:tRNA (guanine-N(1)-)-methyltransferase n=1 Tax=Aliiroseovarius halocynthiae TaxID=985055 RepID=A0A545SUC6_9RHOB|nr:tRNA (guanosine(37)-N1)-methyltransferase TrmD [Aliiroseovarius halocynthiae]TQV68558.1 tRNA (guanosine(37)-N1)-methyltransferase TrmD [Aliiroseovarius halocynthiae]SMR70963.1 tRNA (guanine37-N1)-methyltransferase [Aliiroseovarius halocynthiae]
MSKVNKNSAPSRSPKSRGRSHGRLAISASLKPRELMTDTPRIAGTWTAKVITLFPGAFPGVLGESLTGKALKDGGWALEPIDLRVFGEGKHRNVDDTPAGGGAGMVLRADILGRAIDMAQRGVPSDRAKWPIVYMSPRGKPMDQATARRFADCDGMTILCGRFEGVDERVLEEYQIEEISLGDFVLTGGEIAAQAMLDATVRLLPGVLGNEASTEEESFSAGLLEHPQYTRPAEWRGRTIPEVLTSGHHGKVAAWRREMSEKITRERRPDLWDALSPDQDDT